MRKMKKIENTTQKLWKDFQTVRNEQRYTGASKLPKPTKSGFGRKSGFDRKSGNLPDFRWILGTNPRKISHFRPKKWKVRKKLPKSYKKVSKQSWMSKETRKLQNHQNLPKMSPFFFSFFKICTKSVRRHHQSQWAGLANVRPVNVCH